ncbi:hypothetical protein GCM10010409_14560 [Mycolicibacterium diernhoferi]
MRRRAFGPAVHGFLDTIRDGHPRTPLVVIGPLYCPIHESTPVPGSFGVEALSSGAVRFIALGDPADALVQNRAAIRRCLKPLSGRDPTVTAAGLGDAARRGAGWRG